jgi:hypothetical protein
MNKEDVLADLFGEWLQGHNRFVLYCSDMRKGTSIMSIAPYPALREPAIFSFECPTEETIRTHWPNRLKNNTLSFYETAQVIDDNWDRRVEE